MAGTSPSGADSCALQGPAPPQDLDDMGPQRRLSTSSDASSSGHDSTSKADSNMEYIPTRMTKVSTPKPAANPLQFVKVGPCDLFKSAQETLKKVEEVKKMKREVRDEAEEWQSNLDNWKCSRRKRVEHIIDRVVEVKKLELEEHERNRRKAKTFSEMMEERTSRGRKMSVLIHKDDDSNDLSDLGIGTSSDKSSVSEDYGNDDNHSMDDGDLSVKSNHFLEQNGNTKLNNKGNNITNNRQDDDTSTNTTVSSPEPEEYTYDRAIQGYVNFTETRVKSKTVNNISRTETENAEEASNEDSRTVYSEKQLPVPTPKPRKDFIKVEEDLSNLERMQARKFSGSSCDVQNSEKKLNVPKVDILKRKELFERSESSDANEHSKAASRVIGDSLNSLSIKDRVSHLERQKSEENVEKSKQVKQLSSEISVKDRLSQLERQQSTENQSKACSNSELNSLVSPGDAAGPSLPSLKDRLSSLEQVAAQDCSPKVSADISQTSIKSRLSDLESSKEIPRKVTPDRDPSFRNKLANFRSSNINSQEVSKKTNNSGGDSSAQFSKPDEDEFYRKRIFHRSLDSLDADLSSQIISEPYERVQSLEDLDSCGPNRDYPTSASSNENLVFSSQSGDTDREDSGIHTADVSCSVSQADEPADFADINVNNIHMGNGMFVNNSKRSLDYAPPMIVSQLAKISLTDAASHDKLPARPEVGPKPFGSHGSPKDIQHPTDRDMSSVTYVETETDVSSFLDQALLEEDLKMGTNSVSSGKYSFGANISSEMQENPMKHQQLLFSVAANNTCLLNQTTDILPMAFPLDSSTTAEPPKEKPPPPPLELSDDEDKSALQNNSTSNGLHNNKHKPNLGRLDSTKRIKKDIRRKRSDFLGIEGSNDDSYLDCGLKVAPPPDMTSFLQEERRLEQELYRQMQPTLYPESDHGSNQGESRDSGVELDNHLHSHNMHTDYSHEDQPCENHSRQNSELYRNASSTPEEDDIIKKEREIIEILEKEEQWRYGTNTILSPSDHHLVGEKLAAKLRELEQEKLQLEWERAEELRKAAAEQAARQEEQRRMRVKEQQLRLQEESLREERERLHREQAELERQREILAVNQTNTRQSWESSSSSTAHRSLQDVSGSHVGSHSQLNLPTNNTALNYRLSLPDLQQSDPTAQSIGLHHYRPPPPIPPAKPLSAVSQERHGVNGLSCQGQMQLSSDSLPLSLEPHHHRHNAVGLPAVPMAMSPTSSSGSQQMTRQTLHALSATPRSKIIATDTWVQAKRKPESQRNNRDHYQHWLIQEAEHRRITEQQHRNAASRKSLPANLSQNQQPQPKPTTQSMPQQTSQSWQYHQPHHQHVMHQVPHQHQHSHHQHSHSHPQHVPPVPPPPRQEKPLPNVIIQTLTQRVQNRASMNMNDNNRRLENSPARESSTVNQITSNNINNNNLSNINIYHSHTNGSYAANSQEKMLSVSGKKKCSHCNEELGRGAAMIIESLRLFYHMDCFKCCVCHVQLGDGLMGTDVRVRNHKLHCHNCYSSDDGVKFSCV